MSDEPELLTPRLQLRRRQPGDEAAMVAINQDPEVIRYLNRPVDAAATRALYERINAHWDEYGYGLWAVQSREPGSAGRFIGFAGVDHPAFVPELISIIHPGNVGSQRVAQKLGMTSSMLVHNPVAELEVQVWRIAGRR